MGFGVPLTPVSLPVCLADFFSFGIARTADRPMLLQPGKSRFHKSRFTWSGSQGPVQAIGLTVSLYKSFQ
jgi:hypothetical protein